MSPRYDTVTFLSDYGTADEFVGVVKSVVRALAPAVTVIDLTHEVRPYDTRGGGLLLARSVQYLCAGIVLAVVDPGVGTARRAIAVEVGDGQSVLIGPDNGVLAPAVSMCGGATRAMVLDNPEYQLDAPGPTFAGRDVFAPAAAHLCNGVPLELLGTPVDPASLMPGLVPVTRVDEADGAVVAEVLWVDRYGNVQLNVDPTEVDGWGDRVHVRTDRGLRSARRAIAFAELGVGEVGLLVDSYGLLALVTQRSSAAEELQLAPGDPVQLLPLDDDVPEGISTPIELKRTRPA